MIVRNEAHIVTETLECVAGRIDYWVIVDTGSTDDTRRVIRSFFDRQGIPGELYERPWRDFATNRTEALQLSRGKADYVWIIDADDLVVGDLELTDLSLDAYSLRFGPDLVYWRRQIFRDPQIWRYEGVVHEYPVCAASGVSEARLEGDYHIQSRRLGGRGRDPDTYERDSRLLMEAVKANPNDARSIFYLAQSYLDAGNVQRALHYYTLRAQMAGWQEEIFYARLRAAECMDRLGKPWAEVLNAYLACWQSRPSRAEPLFQVARHYRLAGDFDLGYLFAHTASEIPFPDADNLFVATDVYAWRCLDEQAICAYYLGRKQESFDLCTRLLDSPRIPEAARERVLANRDFSAPAMLESTLIYPDDLVGQLARVASARRRDAPAGPDAEVTLTITTCRRRELFEKTINSFLNCCTDVRRISTWLCVDDGSSAEDREWMRERYPFFEFLFKNPEEKGHARSMNMLLDRLETPFWLHLEDDWHFFVRDAYIEKALAVLEDDPALGQVLFNRNYGETLGCREIAGGTVDRTRREGQRYRRHVYIAQDTSEYRDFSESLPRGTLHVAYWPHHSLRPSLTRTAAIHDIGRFDPKARHFEREYAQRYTDRGYRSAFLDAIHCLHLGPLTWERGDDRRLNAYDLNQESQFGEAPQPRHRLRLLAGWLPADKVYAIWERQSQGYGRWGDIELVHDGRDADYTVIINHPPGFPPVDSLDTARTIVLHMEPAHAVAEWGEWASPNSREFLQVRSHDRFPNALEWYLGSTLPELLTQPVEKTRVLSSVTSSKIADPGQKLRVRFLKHLEEAGVSFDLFGRDNVHGLASYRGPLPPYDKRDGLLSYRYTFAAENTWHANYFTEKIVDAILAECLCFYWGCPNLEHYLDPEVFIRVPLEDPEASRRILERAIHDGEWQRRIEAIRRQKRRLLEELQILPTLARIVHGHVFSEALTIRVISPSQQDRWRRFRRATEESAGPAFLERCGRFPTTSHLALWREVADEDHACLVFEDSARLCRGFPGQLVEICGQLRDEYPDFDLAYLGYRLRDRELEATYHSEQVPARLQVMDWELLESGTYAYVVSPPGARRLLALARRDGVETSIDRLIAQRGSELKIFQAVPQVAFSSSLAPNVEREASETSARTLWGTACGDRRDAG